MRKSLALLITALAIVAVVFVMPSCKKTPAPATCVGSVPDTAYVGQQLTFISCTEGAFSYLWRFGDGATSGTDTAYHTYTTPGTYSCSLTASNGHGSTKTFTVVILRPTNTWTFQTATYNSASAAAVNDTIQTSNFSSTNISNISNLIFGFNSLPTVDGSYQVINAQTDTPTATQISVYVSTPSGRNYASTGRDNATATVTVSGGKVNISLPSAVMVNTANPSDSSTLNATVHQTN